uniref:TSC22 domain family, member 2 n=1 Tax=Sinocyclocheilus grahami TaxID=75366 RepID=A0A672NGL4_SINGR
MRSIRNRFLSTFIKHRKMCLSVTAVMCVYSQYNVQLKNACSDEMCVCLQDLVKSHLMLAVREEVEVMREQIKELSERNAELERENYILRALRDRD